MAAGTRGRSHHESTSIRTSPGAHLRAELQRLGLDQVAVSKATGVSRQSVNNIINGRQAISRAMAGRLGRLTGRSSDYWLSEWFGESGAPFREAVAGVLVNHQIARAVHDGIIAIKPFVPKHLRPASIDLTLGNEGVCDGRTVDLARRRSFALRSGCSLMATSGEQVELALDHLGRIGGSVCATSGLAVLAPLQIEPGFKGSLPFALFNASSASISLHAGDLVASLEIVRLAAAAERP